MKKLILTLGFLALAACSSGGSGGGNGGHTPDHTPHDYAVTAAHLTNTANPQAVDLHQVCDFGYPEVRDETASVVLQDPNIVTGVGCSAAKNYLFEVHNTSADSLFIIVEIDGVDMPQVEVLAGQTFTFTRGY